MTDAPKIKGHRETELEVTYYPNEDIVSVLSCGPWIENYCQSFAMARDTVPELIQALQAAYDRGG